MTLGDGAKKLYRDSGIGLAWNTVVLAGAGAVTEFLANLPGYASVLVAGAAGIITNGIAAWLAKRGPATTTTARNGDDTQRLG